MLGVLCSGCVEDAKRWLPGREAGLGEELVSACLDDPTTSSNSKRCGVEDSEEPETGFLLICGGKESVSQFGILCISDSLESVGRAKFKSLGKESRLSELFWLETGSA